MVSQQVRINMGISSSGICSNQLQLVHRHLSLTFTVSYLHLVAASYASITGPDPMQLWRWSFVSSTNINMTEIRYLLEKKLAYTLVRLHVYTRVLFTPNARARMRTFLRVRRKLQRISRLRRRQLRCQCLLLCYLQAQSKAHAVTIAKGDCSQNENWSRTKVASAR